MFSSCCFRTTGFWWSLCCWNYSYSAIYPSLPSVRTSTVCISRGPSSSSWCIGLVTPEVTESSEDIWERRWCWGVCCCLVVLALPPIGICRPSISSDYWCSTGWLMGMEGDVSFWLLVGGWGRGTGCISQARTYSIDCLPGSSDTCLFCQSMQGRPVASLVTDAAKDLLLTF